MKKILCLAIAILFTSMLFSGVSKESAVDYVLKTVLSDQTDHLEVYVSKYLIADSLDIYDETIAIPYPASWVFFVTDHGYVDNGMSTISLWDPDEYSEMTSFELDTMLDAINCSQKIITMGQCHSGGFVNGLNNVSGDRIAIYSAVAADETAWQERIVTCCDMVTFYFFWISAMKDMYPHIINHEGNNLALPYLDGHPTQEFPYEVFYDPYVSDPLPEEIPLDLDNDNQIQLDEAFLYTNRINYRSQLDDPLNIYFTFGDPPDPPETPQASIDTGFIEGDGILTLGGYCGSVENSQTVSGSFVIGGELVIESGVTLTLEEEGKFILTNGAGIVVENGASLVLREGSQIIGDDDECSITVLQGGNISFRAGVSVAFNSEEQGHIYIQNLTPELNWREFSLSNCDIEITDTDVFVINMLSIDGCSFHIENGDVEILENSDITNSNFEVFSDVSGIGADYEFVMEGCTMLDNESNPAVTLTNYNTFAFVDNHIESHSQGGFYVFECNEGKFRDNTLLNMGSAAISLYHSKATITERNIVDSGQNGVVAFRGSGWEMIGTNTEAPYQAITDCERDAVLFYYDSQPTCFRYNMVYYGINDRAYLMNCPNFSGLNEYIDVKLNYWGDNFDPQRSYNPSMVYLYDPIWPARPSPDSLEVMYQQAHIEWEDGNYSEAKSIFEELVANHADTIWGFSSLKDLYFLEMCCGTNLSALQDYYIDLQDILPDSTYQNMLSFLSNACDIGLNQYKDAIDWLETQTEDPASEYDLMCSIIDLGYTYILMEDSERSEFCGRYPEYKPASKEAYLQERSKMINLMANSGSDTNDAPSSSIIGSNYPNPFNPTTTICFSVPEASKVEMDIYNIKGQKVKRLVNDDYPRGNHKVQWHGINDTGKHVSSGVYFYRLKVNGKSIGVKKMLMLK